MESVEGLTQMLGILSFCMSFAGSFNIFIKIVDPLCLSIKRAMIVRACAEFCGYISRILVGVLTDKIRRRMPFLIIGYIPVVVLKLMMIFIFLPFIPSGIRTVLFIASDVIDLSLNSARDIARDCLISDMCIHHPETLSKMLGIRKTISLAGTILGLIYCTTMFQFGVSNIYLAISSMIAAAIGAFILLTKVTENLQMIHTRQNVKIKLLLIMRNNMWQIFLAMFLLTLSKPNHLEILGRVKDSILANYVQYQPYMNVIRCGILPVIYYLFGAISSLIVSRSSFKVSFYMFTALTIIVVCLNLLGLSSLTALMGTTIVYGLYNGILDTILNTTLLKYAMKNQIEERGTVLALANIVMALSNLLLASILSKFSLPFIVKCSVPVTLVGWVLMLLSCRLS